ncbi:MAG: Bax inhibitor-1/YccA family protein [Proteobacteria bacterium]|nr:Bax inhibitor-1/YccA family protein [Pseudomonadota bacterium]
MSFNPFNTAPAATDRAAFDEGLRAHMLRVYNYMGIGVGLTGLVAWLVATTPALTQLFFTAQHQPTMLGMIAIFAPLGFIFFFSFAAMRSSLSLLQGLFWLFCATMGLSMASLFIIFTNESIARTFFVVAAMFGATSLYGYTTRSDLTKMGSFMVMGLIGILLAGVVNLFLHSSGLQFAVSVLGVVIFTGLTAWDTQRIKEAYAQGYGVETNHKLALFGALSLYLNFINLFQLMLSFMGTRRD